MEIAGIGLAVFLIFFGSSIITGLVGLYVAKQKGRSRGEGFLFGFFFHVLGLIVVSCLPNKVENLI